MLLSLHNSIILCFPPDLHAICAQIIRGLNFRVFCGSGATREYFNLQILGEGIA